MVSLPEGCRWRVKDQACERGGLTLEVDMTPGTTHTHRLEGTQSVARVKVPFAWDFPASWEPLGPGQTHVRIIFCPLDST